MSNENLVIVIAKEFSDAPGARYRADGPDSGEQFFEEHLRPKYHLAIEQGKKLIIDLDGTYGYATSFISEAFGRLSREFGVVEVLKTIELKSEEDKNLKEYVINTIRNPDE